MRVPTALITVALALTGTLTGVQFALPVLAHADEDTISQNVSRDGWDSSEPDLTPAWVSAPSFGQVFETPVNGQVYAQPLSVGNNVLVATENDYVYSINRNTGAVNWSTQLGTPYAAVAEKCEQSPVVSPYIGVTSAPVYDPATGTLYVSAMLSGPPDDDTDLSTPDPTYNLFAVNEANGKIDWKKTIGGSPTDSHGVTFSAYKQMQRTGLLLLNGSVYMGFGALCADGVSDGATNHYYDGFIAGVNTKTESETLWSDQSDASSFGYGGIWQGGGGLVADGNSIYFSTGNGTAPPLNTPSADVAKVTHFAQSLVKLNVESNGSLKPADFFSPGNASAMTSDDHDFGSGGPILLPFTTKDYPRGLLATADKEAYTYLLSAASLGGRSKTTTGSTAVFTGSPSLVDNPPSTTSTPSVTHGLWGHMAAFAGTTTSGKTTTADDYIYYEGTGWGSEGNMYALKFNGANPAKPTLQNVASTTQQFGFSSGSPVVTSNGTSASSGVVWEVQANDESGAGGSLDAFAAVPTSTGVLQELWSAPIGNAAQFTVPATSNGRVYVGARNDGTAADCLTDFESPTYTSTDSQCVGDVYGFGGPNASLTGPTGTVNVGHVALGKVGTTMVKLDNNGNTPVTITKISTPAMPFGISSLTALNQPIPEGGSVLLPVTFTPQARGTITGKFVVTTTDGINTNTTTVTVGGTGEPAASGTAVVPSPGGGWTLNGSSTMTPTTLQLTPAKANQVGSAVFYQSVPSSGLHATFTARLSGGNDGDGLTFSLLNSTSATTAKGCRGGRARVRRPEGGLGGARHPQGRGRPVGQLRGHRDRGLPWSPGVRGDLHEGAEPSQRDARHHGLGVQSEGHRRGQRARLPLSDRPGPRVDRAPRLHGRQRQPR